MAKDETTTLQDYESEEISDCLVKIEKSFGIEFDYDKDFCSSMTFGELCNIIDCKIVAENIKEGCTSQQAFYRIRQAISETQGIDKKIISPSTSLAYLFPRRFRHQLIYSFQQQLGCNLDFYRIHNYIATPLFLLFPVSFILLFFSWWKLALAGMCASILGLMIAGHYAKELQFATVGSIATEMNKYHYRQSHRNPDTINMKEIKKILRDMFINDFALDPPVMTDDTKLW